MNALSRTETKEYWDRRALTSWINREVEKLRKPPLETPVRLSLPRVAK